MAEFKGKVLLIVNVASKCGLTPQYEGLEKLYEQYKGQGLVIAGFPANDFKARSREPTRRFSPFAQLNYGVKFPLFRQDHGRRRPQASALFGFNCRAAQGRQPVRGPFREEAERLRHRNESPSLRSSGILRSFSSADPAKLSKRFAPDTAPDAPELVAAIEAELAKLNRRDCRARSRWRPGAAHVFSTHARGRFPNTPATPTQLEHAASSYLRSARHQPVQWHAWGEAAFARAQAEDKPILLDIGAVWCHWCHVMDRESYEDPEIAALINEHFVAVKVDRDERPDVDARYQAAVSAISGQGGWPLTAFLTPDGRPYFGGTYFPRDDRYGRPGFGRVLAGHGAGVARAPR